MNEAKKMVQYGIVPLLQCTKCKKSEIFYSRHSKETLRNINTKEYSNKARQKCIYCGGTKRIVKETKQDYENTYYIFTCS